MYSSSSFFKPNGNFINTNNQSRVEEKDFQISFHFTSELSLDCSMEEEEEEESAIER